VRSGVRFWSGAPTPMLLSASGGDCREHGQFDLCAPQLNVAQVNQSRTEAY